MRVQEIGLRLRQARLARGISQAELAKTAGVSRTLVNQLENGVLPDVTLSKLRALLEKVGLSVSLEPAPGAKSGDYLRMACTTASVSYKAPLTESELIRALLTGKVPAGRRAHFRTLLEEAPAPLLKGLVDQVAPWVRRDRALKNLVSIGREVASTRNIAEWPTIR